MDAPAPSLRLTCPRFTPRPRKLHMPTTPLGPLTETITIERDQFGLAASCWNGPHRVVLARTFGVGEPVLKREGGPLRETLPGVQARDVLDLLAAGKCGDFSVDVHTVRPAARRDVDFGGES